MLFEKKLLSQAEFDQRSAQAEVARRQYDIARNGADAAVSGAARRRARASAWRARRSPTRSCARLCRRRRRAAGVGRRLRDARHESGVGDAHQPAARLQLTVPQQYSVEVGVGRAVSLEVDTAPGKTFTGQVRYVSPALQTDSRTLIVEAVVPNDDGSL